MEPSTDSSVRRTQSDLGGQALITAALLGSNWNDATLLPTMMTTANGKEPSNTITSVETRLAPGVAAAAGAAAASASIGGDPHKSATRNRVRKLTRHYAKAHLRRSASQPVVLHSGDVTSTSSTSSTVLINSEDDDAGLCLSEDDSSEDTDAFSQHTNNQRVTSAHQLRFIRLQPGRAIWRSTALTPAESDSTPRRFQIDSDESTADSTVVSNHIDGEQQEERVAGRFSAVLEGWLAIALWDHVGVEAEELHLTAGDIIHIVDLSDADWWWAAKGDKYGWVPASYVQVKARSKVPFPIGTAGGIHSFIIWLLPVLLQQLF